MTYLGRLRTHLLSVSCKFEVCPIFSEKTSVNLDISYLHLSKQRSRACWFSPSTRPLLL